MIKWLRCLLWNWQRERIIRKLNDPESVISAVRQYEGVSRKMSYSMAGYRQRKPYSVRTVTRNLDEMIKVLSDIDTLISNESYEMGRIAQRTRETFSLDRWLVNHRREPYTEPEAMDALRSQLEPILGALLELGSHDNDATYVYYTAKFRPYFLDVIEVVDALTCLQLGVMQDDTRGYPSDFAAR